MKTAILSLGFCLISGTLARREIDFIDNHVIAINDGILESVKEIPFDHLNLSGRKIHNLRTVTFENLDLKYLSLADNYLWNLPEFAFRSLRKLEYLSLANNRIVPLPLVFGGLKNLKVLDIRNNNIRTLERGSFYGLRGSVVILSDGNSFGNVTSEHFEKPFDVFVAVCIVDGIVKSMDVFDEDKDYGNADKCVTRILPVEADLIEIIGENVTGFESGWYRLRGINVTRLDLRFNKIREITPEILNDLPRGLTSVNLANNFIKSVTDGVIDNRNLRELDLGDNGIHKISTNAFANMKNCIINLCNNKLSFSEVFLE